MNMTGTWENRPAEAEPRTEGGVLWAWAGAAAGAAGVAGIQASLAISAAYDPDNRGDVVKIAEEFATTTTQLTVMHVTLMLATVLLPVFAAGLYRRLRARVPADSLLPSVAALGLVLTSVATLMGTGLDTELIFGAADDAAVSPEFLTFGSHWVGTIPWLWVGSGLTGVALAAASFRYRAVPRWLGAVAALFGGLTLLTGISPLQYMAGFPGPVLVLIAGLGLAFSRR
ncbi:hypothetical protein LO762_03890 [Actinocorallia sp. API 0066]|uniref:hypothetical protein n=1 Tax=Actinocorallia sp. API 0066 TaxID=2896846 RepID=UPI001E5A3F0D|nr:hypothetical protein [Actinocorallia sp. API 0066]MCD0448339.1 hypothetical protein [Actinocorallia sp. API 0066]